MYEKLGVLLLAAILLFGLASCGKDKSTSPTPTITGDCRGCHTDEVKLRALAVPDTAGGGDSGEG
jgi:hypothetical protein